MKKIQALLWEACTSHRVCKRRSETQARLGFISKSPRTNTHRLASGNVDVSWKEGVYVPVQELEGGGNCEGDGNKTQIKRAEEIM